MQDGTPSFGIRVLLAVVATVTATALRWLLDPWLGDLLPYATFFLAVVFCAWRGGVFPALLATALGLAAAWYFFLPPQEGFHLPPTPHLVGVGVFAVVSTSIALLSSSMHRAQQRARKSEREAALDREELRLTLTSIGDAVITTDGEGRVTFLNPVAESLTGWKSEEAAGKALDKVFRIANEDTREPVADPVARVLETGQVVGLANHTVLIRRDGADVPIDDSAAPIRGADGAIEGVVLVFRDVADRRRLARQQRDLQAELERQVDERTKELRETKERFRLLVEGTEDYAIFMLDPGGHVRSWNPGAVRIKGYVASEILGQHFSLFYPPDERDRARFDAKLELAAKVGRFDEEGWRVRKDGSRFWASVLITALRDEKGALRGFSKITRDLTEKRAADENARKLRESEAARRAALEMSNRLRQSENALRDADRRKDEFLATLAHELRNPLAAVRTGLALMGRTTDRDAVERTRAMMERQITQLVRLVDDLLDVSRISRGKIVLRRRRVSLDTIVKAALDTWASSLRQESREIDVEVAPEPVWIDGDEVRLAQAVGNLIHNAVKYTPPDKRIRLRAGAEGSDAVIRVKDEGAGIPPDMLERIFDLFTQVDHSLDRSQGGLGIGLTIVRQLVEKHGGKVEAHSEGEGRGSEFVIRLPRAGAEAPALTSEPRQRTTSRRTTPRRVLVVDDNDDAAKSLELLLRLNGHDVRTAADGEEGVEVARAFRPQVVFLDLGMPRMNGLDAARRIRAEPWGRDVLLVALTGWGQESDVARARAAGFDRHLVKPVEAAIIEGVLESLPDARQDASTAAE